MGRRKILNTKQVVEIAARDIHAIKHNTIANIARKKEEPDIIAAVIIDMAKDEEELRDLIRIAIYQWNQEGEKQFP